MLFRPKKLIQNPLCATVSGESGSESGQTCGHKIRSHLMWSSIMGADHFIFDDCGQIMWSGSRGFRPSKVGVL